MGLPPQLQQAIEAAEVAIQQHPEHELLPFYRNEIYEAISPAIYNKLGELIDPLAYRTRLTLSLLTGQHIMPIWREVRPDDNWPQDLLDMVERVLHGEMTPVQAGIVAETAFERAAELAGTMDTPALERASTVLFAAIEALFEASGAQRFDLTLTSRNATDADLDPWSSDPAMWAAVAYAGAGWDPTSEPIKRKEFWEWWLRQAIPTAWKMVHEITEPVE